MKIIDLQNELNLLSLMPASVKTASENGSAVDLQGYQGKLKAILDSSAGGGGDHTLDVKIQDSADGSTGWADVSGATFTQVTNAAASQQAIPIDSRGVKRYIRAVATIAGTSPSFTFAVNAVGQKQTM